MKDGENLPAVIYEVKPIRILNTPIPPTDLTKTTKQYNLSTQTEQLGKYIDIYV